VWAAPGRAKVSGSVESSGTDEGEHESVWALPSLLVLLAAMVAMGVLSVARGQDANWDLKNYHVYNGYAFLEARLATDIAPAQLQTYYNPYVDAATYLVIEHAPPRVVGFVLGALHGLDFWLLYLLARTVIDGLGRKVAVVASVSCAALGVFGAIGIAELGTTFHDLTMSAFVLGGLLALTRGMLLPDVSGAQLGRVALAGCLFGLGAGLKYTVVMYALAAMAATFVAVRNVRAGLVLCAVLGAAEALGFAASAGHWMLVLYRSFANPLFPYYNEVFRSPYTEARNFVDDMRVPRTLGRALELPFLYVTNGGEVNDLPFRDVRFAVLCGLGTIIVLLAVFEPLLSWKLLRPAAARPRTATLLTVFFAVGYVVWLRKWAIYRYVAPLEELAPLLSFVAVSKLMRDRKRLVIVAILGFVLAGATTKAADYGRVPWGESFLGVRVPPIGSPTKTTVVIASWDPVSYVVPAFPREVRFVRIESNFFDPSRKTRLAEMVAGALGSKDRDYYLLTVYDGLESSRSALAVYSLAIVEGACKPLPSRLDAGLLLCTLRKVENALSREPGGEPVVFGAVATAAGMSGTLSTPVNPLPVCIKTDHGTATISWTARGTAFTEIHVGAPNGPLFAQGGANGTTTTGDWVRDGTTFYLQNVWHAAPLSPEHTLARLVFRVVPSGPCP
jgi:hypothetical protein